MGTIVLGYDASPGARAALEQALDLARAFGDRLVMGFGVHPPGTAAVRRAEHRQAMREQASRLHERGPRSRDGGVEARGRRSCDDRPAPALVEPGGRPMTRA